ncbi:hypothetical protein [Oceanithermus sp.]|uniref:hypothetical protein n=1 Tax=Oceanithermus sp. TaxID=2268145 RepID=UPI00257C75CF|nr:hypothetical protein [Oceanithermus sp.]
MYIQRDRRTGELGLVLRAAVLVLTRYRYGGEYWHMDMNGFGLTALWRARALEQAGYYVHLRPTRTVVPSRWLLVAQLLLAAWVERASDRIGRWAEAIWHRSWKHHFRAGRQLARRVASRLWRRVRAAAGVALGERLERASPKPRAWPRYRKPWKRW